ncbi:Cullin-domain-containing protein [Ramaria rubella]|nr:Cullin-domain-containing protein [Ramaria rubella]
MQSSTGKGRVKPKIKPPRMPGGDTTYHENWARLSSAIREIHNHNAYRLSYEETYRYAYNLVISKHGDVVYNGVNQLIAENLDMLAKEEVAPAFPTGGSDDPMHQSQEGDRLLKATRKVWDDHMGNMQKLTQVLRYMDKFYTRSANVPGIWDAGLKHFLDHIILSGLYPIKNHLVSTVLKQIQLERDGYVINRSAMKSCVDVLLELSVDRTGATVYAKYLEPDLLRESEVFYKAEGEKLMDTCDAPEYLERAETRFRSEEVRTHHYLSSRTNVPLRCILESCLLTPHLLAIIRMPHSGLDPMIDQDKTDDLARMYRLFKMVETGPPTLKKALRDSIARRGKEVNDLAGAMEAEGVGAQDDDGGETVDPKGKGKAKAKAAGSGPVAMALKWVEDVLALKDKFDHVLKYSFSGDTGVQTALNEAFESFINLNPKAPEFISLFIDDHLKKGLKGKTDEEVDAVLDKTITVFRFVSEKDIFERYYKAHLAKRLLFNRSTSDDAERGMLAKLKIECGYQFTQKLEGMFHDMKLSADTQEAYKAHLANTSPPPIELSVTVMTSTFWPMNHSVATCTLAPDMVKSCMSFENFYLHRHSGRKLTWQPGLGNADVRARFRSRTHDLNVSTYALVILLLFEDLRDDEVMTYEEIQNATQLAEIELKRNLQSLACAKYKVLKKHPPSRDIAADDSFSFNNDFTASLQRIKISTVASKVESTEERRETRDRIEEERKHQTDASLVRIMKDRKHMVHNDLINEATKQLSGRFQPQPTMLKKRIESLIEREYLERGADRKSYTYLA